MSSNPQKVAPASKSTGRVCDFFLKGRCGYGDNCKFRHPDGVEQPQGLRRQGLQTVSKDMEPRKSDPLRRFFDRCTKGADFSFRDLGSVERFANAVAAYTDDDLPWRLTRTDECGMRRVKEAIQMHAGAVLLTFIDVFMKQQWRDARFNMSRNICLRELLTVPDLVPTTTRIIRAKGVNSVAELVQLGTFGLDLAFAEPRVLQEQASGAQMGELAGTIIKICSDRKTHQSAQRVAERLAELCLGAHEVRRVASVVPLRVVQHLPGGRHSNDRAAFREIAIVPLVDELTSTEPPFLPIKDVNEVFLREDQETQLLDRHFRLLREDLVASVRDELGADKKPMALPVTGIVGLELHSFHTLKRNQAPGEKATDVKYQRGKVGLKLVLDKSKMQLKGGSTLASTLQKRRLMQQGSLVLLRDDDQPVAVGRVVRALRDEELDREGTCIRDPCELGIAFDDASFVSLVAGSHGDRLSLMALTGSFFAFEPVLACLQNRQSLVFREELLLEVQVSAAPEYAGRDRLQAQIDGQVEFQLDEAQRAAFTHAIESRVALIVGPPGTGKSFVGAELAHAILAVTSEKMLVVCYTNHALDQFLNQLLDKGNDKIVRIGGRSKDQRLEPYTLFNLRQKHQLQRSRAEHSHFYAMVDEQRELQQEMEGFMENLRASASWACVKVILEEEDVSALNELTIQQPDDGFQAVGQDGRDMKEDYLWNKWRHGDNPPPLYGSSKGSIWHLSLKARQEKAAHWQSSYKCDVERSLCEAKRRYDQLAEDLADLQRSMDRVVLQDCRVIGATTTGAAMNQALIEGARPGIVLMEEAGEVLEAHVISSLSDSVKQLIMIGDHQQLRPKVETHKLTVAAGHGYDLNRSLFERLIRGGLPHSMLRLQHRMRPEISAIARHMTYPDLRDGGGTQGRPDILGLASNCFVIDHRVPEQGEKDDLLMGYRTLSKVNMHEAQMAVQVVRYLLYQGYTPGQVVILTPYLGQLKKIKDILNAQDIRTTIGVMDEEDLVRLGVEQPWEADHSRRSRDVRVSTIDNYQGEESDIVVASLVRSNRKGQLGFLGKADAEQRVNVLCTRARNGFILIGNTECLKQSPLWERLLGLFRHHIHRGLPIKCQQHNERCQHLETPAQLRQMLECGAGCGRPCDTLLACGHPCPLQCHPWNHDEVKCSRPERVDCAAGLHRIERPCSSDTVPLCVHDVIEYCPAGHPLVRKCCDAKQPPCKVCALILQAQNDRESLAAHRASEEAAIMLEAAQHASQNEDVSAENSSTRAHAFVQMAALAASYEEQKQKLEQGLGTQLDDAEQQQRGAVIRAYDKLAQQKQEDEARLQARQEESHRELRRVKERMEAEVRARDEELLKLHEAWQHQAQLDEAACEGALSTRPKAESVAEKLEQVRGMASTATCGICLDDELTVLDGVLCKAVGPGHFVCDGCFTHHIQNEAQRQEFKGDVCCPYRTPAMGGCDSRSYPDAIIARHADADAFDILNKKRLQLRESELTRDLEKDFNERLAREKEKMITMAAKDAEERKILEARTHIAEDLLTLKCPRCGQAFLDFSGCFALTCVRQGCGCGFCACCLEDCGDDAHTHVARCKAGGVFGSFDEFEAQQRQRKRKIVADYLKQEPGLRGKILEECKKDLQDCGIWPID